MVLVFVIVFATSFALPKQFVTNNLYFNLNSFLSGRFHVVLTAMFMHGSVQHLVFNILLLLLIGPPLEQIIGWRKYLVVFVTGGVITFLLSAPTYSQTDFLVGASGSIFTLMAALAMLNPLFIKKTRAYSFVFGEEEQVLTQIGEEEFNKANFMITLLILFFIQFTIIALYTNITSESVGNTGHLIGLVLGAIFGLLWSEKWQQILRGVLKPLLVVFLIIILLVYAYQVVFKLINPTSQSLVEAVLQSFGVRLFATPEQKCDTLCLEEGFDYGSLKNGFCECKYNTSIIGEIIE